MFVQFVILDQTRTSAYPTKDFFDIQELSIAILSLCYNFVAKELIKVTLKY